VLVTGDWGIGKTTLLQGIQHHLDSGREHSRTIWFDAWRYEGSQPLMPALIRAVWESLPDGIRRRDDIMELAKKALRIAWKSARQFAPAAIGALGVPGLGLVINKEVLEAVGGAVGEAVAAEGHEPGHDQFDELREQLGSLLKHGWPEIEEEADGELDGARFPTVFIDDLDRCAPDQAVLLLDQIRTLVADGGHLPCHFVIAMDREVLVHAISSKFHGISGYSGNRYLEKVFPLSFAVPPPNREEASGLVAALFGDSEEDLEELNALTEVLMSPFFANPRLMKRCINRFNLVRRFEGEVWGSPTQNATLVRWLAASERWPRLRRLLTDHDESYWEQVGEYIAGISTTAPGPEAEEVLREKGAGEWIARQIFGPPTPLLEAYRGADRRLRRWGL
jgi:KAP family P-loop domain